LESGTRSRFRRPGTDRGSATAGDRRAPSWTLGSRRYSSGQLDPQWHALQIVHAVDLVRQVLVALVVVVHLPQRVLEPADHGLGPVDAELRVTVPHARGGHLERGAGRVPAEAEEPVPHGVVAQSLGTVLNPLLV